MSSRFESVTVYALDSLGERHRIYDSYHYAGGCEYKDMITVANTQYQISWYPLEDKVVETGAKLPALTLADLQSYFCDEPTKQMCEVLDRALLKKAPLVRFTMLIQQETTEQYIHVTRTGIESGT